MQQQQLNSVKMTNSQAFGLIYIVLNTHRVCITVFTRRWFGTRAFDPYCITAFFVLLFMAVAHRWMTPYLFAWFFALVWQRIESFRNRWNGGHSNYPGYPWLAMLWPGIETEQRAKEAEPLLCLIAGAVLMTIYPPLGAFILFGFVSFGGCLLLDRYIESQRLRAMRDAELEMKYYGEKYRQRW